MKQHPAVLLLESDLPRADDADGESNTRLVSRSYSTKFINNYITTIPPHGTNPLHHHNCEESVLMLSGAAIGFIGDAELAVETGNISKTHVNLPHQSPSGSDVDNMRISWADASAGATHTLVETGDLPLIEAEHRA